MPIYRNKTDKVVAGVTVSGEYYRFSPFEEKTLNVILLNNPDLELVSISPNTTPLLSTSLTVPSNGTATFDLIDFLSNMGDTPLLKSLYMFHSGSSTITFFINDHATISHDFLPGMSILFERDELKFIKSFTFSNSLNEDVIVRLFMTKMQ